MGLSISASASIIFVASVLVFGALLGAFNTAQHLVVDAQRSSNERVKDAMQTHITIIGVDGENSTIKVANDGSITLDLSGFDIFLNGTMSKQLITNISVDGNNSTRLLMPFETVEIVVNADLTGTPIEVVTGNGVKAYY
jgi:archaeal flagellar protein FlaF